MSRDVILVTRASVAGSALLSVLLFLAFAELGSTLAMAQASDSLMDVAGALVLALAARVAREPKDAGHPMGHSRAEPLGALFIAALAVLLGFEVVKSAVTSLLEGRSAELAETLLGLFALKVAFKTVIFVVARGNRNTTLRALAVDARNDMLLGLVSVIGFFLARESLPLLDAWLSIPIGVYIAWSGFGLGRENVELLMGAAPDSERQARLLDLAASEPGVLDAHDLGAQYLGNQLSLHVHVTVDGELTVREGHEIGVRVQRVLEAEGDVVHCSVHVDPGPRSAS